MTAQPVVYRVYDKTDRLIYIGSTGNFEDRFNQHRSSSWWMNEVAHRFELEWYPSIEEARQAEADAIAAEDPAFNAHLLRRPGRPKYIPLTVEDQRACRAWLDADPERIGRVPQSMHWVMYAPDSDAAA